MSVPRGPWPTPSVEELRPGSRQRGHRHTVQLLQLSAVAVLAAVLLVLAFSSRVEDFCGDHQLGCGLLSGFTSTGLLLAAGYFFLYVWTLRRVRRAYLALAAHEPQRLFSAPPRLWGPPAGRPRLLERVTAELGFSRRGAPVLVLGEGGAGKTTFLLELTRHLAVLEFVPVPVSLRGASAPLDIRAMARAEFVRLIDPLVRKDDDALRVWRRLTAEGSLVVLADGLDEAAPGLPDHERDQAIRSALAAARNDRLAMVIASRPEVVPAGSAASTLELGDLEPDEARNYLAHAFPPAAHYGQVDDLLDAGRVTRVPFYLNVVALLLRAGVALPEHSGDPIDLVRLRLLDAWAGLLGRPEFRADAELTELQRERTLATLAEIAYVMSAAALTECEMSRLTAQGASDEPRDGLLQGDLAAVEAGARLGLIRVSSRGDETVIRFGHAIGQSYFASRFLLASRDCWQRTVTVAESTEMYDALVMFGAACERATSSALCAALIARAPELADDRALACVTTALEVAADKGLDGTGEAFDEPMAAAWTEAGSRRKLTTIERLAKHDAPVAYRQLLRATHDDSYPVRWHAAQAIVGAGTPAFQALRATLEQTVSLAESGEPPGRDFAVAGWLLPDLATGKDADPAAVALLRRALALVGPALAPGHQASIAQGFKLSARIRPEGLVPREIVELSDTCGFWYARLMLIHTLTLVAHADDARRAEVRRLLRGAAKREQHPFVHEGHRIALHALRDADPAQTVWEDEAVAIETSASTLRPDASVLLSDVVILLNLTERGMNPEAIEERKEEIYGRQDLPHCLSVARTRTEPLFRSGCYLACPFRLCPYPIVGEIALARTRFSEAFCRHQGQLYSQGLGRRWALRRAGSWSVTSRTDMAAFWQEMQSRAS